jgi:hypothetical protein
MPEHDVIYRVVAFIDYWDLQSSLNEGVGGRFQIDWSRFPRWLATKAVSYAHGLPTANLRFEGANVYLALDPPYPGDTELKEWAISELGRKPGVRVIFGERVTGPRNCNACHLTGTPDCRRCKGTVAGSGGQTTTDVITVDIFQLTREEVFDIAVIVSSDTTLIPAARYLKTKGKLVVVGGFLPRGAEMARECSAFLDIGHAKGEFEKRTTEEPAETALRSSEPKLRAGGKREH